MFASCAALLNGELAGGGLDLGDVRRWGRWRRVWRGDDCTHLPGIFTIVDGCLPLRTLTPLNNAANMAT